MAVHRNFVIVLSAVLCCVSSALPQFYRTGTSCPFVHTHKNVVGMSAVERSSTVNALEILNDQLQVDYQINSRNILDQHLATHPLIIGRFNDLILYYRGQRYEVADLTPQLYTDLKLVSHLALSAWVMLIPARNSTHLDSLAISQLQQYMNWLPDARQTLVSLNFTDVQRVRSYAILDAVESLISGALSSGSITEAQLMAWGRGIVDMIDANVYDATVAVLNAAHDQIMAWKQMMSVEEWSNAFAVVMSGHMPRTRHIYMQYFQRVFQLSSSEDDATRLIYAEGLDEEGALNLAAAHIMDYTMAVGFWNDGDHMHSDLLANAATAYLNTLLPLLSSGVAGWIYGVSILGAVLLAVGLVVLGARTLLWYRRRLVALGAQKLVVEFEHDTQDSSDTRVNESESRHNEMESD